MKQSRFMSLLESTVNILVGFGISLGAQMLFLPMLGVTISFTQNFVFAVIMTVISIARSYILRRIFEALHIRRPLSPFMQAVVAERFRQIEVEGHSHAEDDKLPDGSLARAGACYVFSAAGMRINIRDKTLWPWRRSWWKPKLDKRRDLVRGCALAIAEGERFDRLKTKRPA